MGMDVPWWEVLLFVLAAIAGFICGWRKADEEQMRYVLTKRQYEHLKEEQKERKKEKEGEEKGEEAVFE